MKTMTGKRVPMRPLALGEKTGHHHSLMVADERVIDDCGEMYEDADGTVRVKITDENVLLGHQEHKTHAVAPIAYQSVQQRENTDWGARPVVD